MPEPGSPKEAASLAGVRSACAAVARRARSVRLCRDRLAAYAGELAAVAADRPALDPRYHHLGRGRETVAYIVSLDAINFGSGWFPWLVERQDLGGYFTIASALSEHFARHGPLAAAELAAIGPGDCARILGQEAAPAPLGELMQHFARSWQELGRVLLARFDGSFDALLAGAGRRAEGLVGVLATMPSFDDVAIYEGRRVPFYKRAQLMAADLTLAFDGTGPGRFDDLERLTVFADNQVPHVLRRDGVLEYDDTLEALVDGGEELAAGSREEIEIRACTIHVAELLVRELAALGVERQAWELDQLLWNRGLEPRYRESPAHRTRTLFY